MNLSMYGTKKNKGDKGSRKRKKAQKNARSVKNHYRLEAQKKRKKVYPSPVLAGGCCDFSDAPLFTDGNIFLFQLLCKGTTDLCHLKMSPAVALHISSLIVHDQATHPPIPPTDSTYLVSKCLGNCWTRNFAKF